MINAETAETIRAEVAEIRLPSDLRVTSALSALIS
jgi:hypothetical protein